MNTTEATRLACQRCGEPATVINQGQPFCDADWAAISDTWSVCLDCGQVFETVFEQRTHVAAHRASPHRGEFHYSRTHQFSRIA